LEREKHLPEQSPAIDFSVVIPSFRDIRIIETIQSINQQSYPRERIEIVIVDGGSGRSFTDEVRRHLVAQDLLVSEPDHGIFDAINKGISRASGAVLFTMGSDDKFACLDAVATFMECFKNPAVQYVCAGIAYTNQDWRPIRDWPANLPTFMNFMLGRQVSHFGFACRPRVYRETGHFDLSHDFSADFDFFLRLSKRKLAGVKLARRLVLMKSGGISSKNLRNVRHGNAQMFRSGFSHYGMLVIVHFVAKPFVKVLQFLRVKTALHPIRNQALPR
jgi:glycosyltransferase